ncbi:MAG TPA: polysaccharide deacetylase family protein [Armatimonadota bacterium]|jgi:peptidoglycan/xylan/chitin deacetylase (PgdA/CDA1 family)
MIDTLSRLSLLLPGAALLIACLPAVAQEPPFVATYHGEAQGALALTFDDGSQNQVDIAVPLLNEFGVKGTFFLVTGVIREQASDPRLPNSSRSGNGGASWDEWRAVAAQGHEIANHSLTHANLPRTTDPAVLDREINDSAALITHEIGQAPLTFCYPGNGYNDAVRKLVAVHHVGDRVRCWGYGNPEFTAAQANAQVERTLAEGGELIAMIHGIEEGYMPLSREVLRQHLEYLASLDGRVWVATFADLCRYRQERESASLEVVARSAHELSFRLTSPRDPAIFTVPLTVVIPLPGEAITAARASYPDAPAASLPTRVLPGRIQVDVPPGPRVVRLRWR